MKLAIQGHSKRGKEVIQILENLGGINRKNHKGRYTNYFYYVAGDDNTIAWTGVRPQHLNVFTLEEFEKEFPFKVGDKVRDRSDDEIGTILGFIDLSAFIDVCNELMYVVDFEKSGHANMPVEKLKPYTEMKEGRNITLTLDKAQEWYKKGGELKEVALQAYSEEELIKVGLPKTWEEFRENNPVKVGECWLAQQDIIHQASTSSNRKFKNWIPSKQSAEAHLALIQLEQLRDCWRQGWVPDYTKTYKKFRIKKLGTEYIVDWSTGLSDFLVFQTEELAKEFLKCFRDLIELAGDLI